MGIIQKISTAAHNSTTYRAGLLQTKSYRILKHSTAAALQEFDIATIEWAFLGLLNDVPHGMRPGDVADELGVEASFITHMVTRLKKTGLIELTTDRNDSRARNIALTSRGREFVIRAEQHLRIATKPLLRGIPLRDLITYLDVMQRIIENG